jgi:hypothetical protein
MCVLACSMLGDGPALVLALVGLVYGVWQRRSKVAVVAEKQELKAENEQLRKLSLSPPPAVLLPVDPALWRQAQSSLTPPPPPPLTDPHTVEHAPPQDDRG